MGNMKILKRETSNLIIFLQEVSMKAIIVQKVTSTTSVSQGIKKCLRILHFHRQKYS